MKQLWCAMSLMAGSLFFSVNASADTSSGALLQQMNLASQSLNYELSFVSINKQGVESLRYRHATEQSTAGAAAAAGRSAPGSGPARYGNQLF
jgi:negative regulator of sigma E activity